MTVEATLVTGIEGYTGKGIESDHQREVKATAASYLRSAALVDSQVREAVDKARNLPVKNSNGNRPSPASVRAFEKAENPVNLTRALKMILGESGLYDLVPRWTTNFEAIVNGGRGDEYLDMISDDPRTAGLFVDASTLARVHLRNLGQEVANPSRLPISHIVPALR